MGRMALSSTPMPIREHTQWEKFRRHGPLAYIAVSTLLYGLLFSLIRMVFFFLHRSTALNVPKSFGAGLFLGLGISATQWLIMERRFKQSKS